MSFRAISRLNCLCLAGNMHMKRSTKHVFFTKLRISRLKYKISKQKKKSQQDMPIFIKCLHETLIILNGRQQQGCVDISINRFISVFAVRYGSVIGLAAYRYKGKQLKLKISNSNLGKLLLFLQFQSFFTFTVLEVSSCNFLAFLLMFCFLNDETLKCIKEYYCVFYYDIISPYNDYNNDLN